MSFFSGEGSAPARAELAAGPDRAEPGGAGRGGLVSPLRAVRWVLGRRVWASSPPGAESPGSPFCRTQTVSRGAGVPPPLTPCYSPCHSPSPLGDSACLALAMDFLEVVIRMM